MSLFQWVLIYLLIGVAICFICIKAAEGAINEIKDKYRVRFEAKDMNLDFYMNLVLYALQFYMVFLWPVAIIDMLWSKKKRDEKTNQED